MRRRYVSAFALFTAVVLLLPTPLLAVKEGADSEGFPDVVCRSPKDKQAAPKEASKVILRVKEKANVRWGPATSYDMVYSNPAPKHYPLEALCKYEATYPDGSKKEWYFVRDFEGQIGWVYAPLVEEGPAVIVKVKQALARSGPGPDKPAVWNVTQGYTLKVLEKKGKWYHIEDTEGEKAWIYEDVLWGSTD